VDETLREELVRVWASPETQVIFLAFDGAELVGLCRAELVDEGPCPATIPILVVRSDRRNARVGGVLLDTALNWCSQHGVSEVSVEVIAENRSAMRFYERAGFRPLLVTYIRQESDVGPTGQP
jgi:GNAT superfamily N-acetyltransferase